MKAYSFSMEKILNLRETKEKDIIEDMGKIQRKLQVQKDTLNELKEDVENINKNSFKNILDLQYQSLCKSKIREDIDRQTQIINLTNVKLEQTRRELIEAQKDRKVMEKLKEKDQEKYYEKIRYEEQKELDEIAVLKFNSDI